MPENIQPSGNNVGCCPRPQKLIGLCLHKNILGICLEVSNCYDQDIFMKGWNNELLDRTMPIQEVKTSLYKEIHKNLMKVK